MSIDLGAFLSTAPVVAVLRGISPAEAVPVGDALVEAGVSLLEVTLDSPEPFESLRLLADRHGEGAIVAAGTVLRAADVERVKAAGGRMIVAPNFSPAVVAEARAAGLPCCPGVMTPSEAFAALEAGADMLKLFPGDALPPKAVKGIRAVLPRGTVLMVTGGVDADTIPAFLGAGANGVGLGSALFVTGKPAEEVGAAARRFVEIAKGARA